MFATGLPPGEYKRGYWGTIHRSGSLVRDSRPVVLGFTPRTSPLSGERSAQLRRGLLVIASQRGR